MRFCFVLLSIVGTSALVFGMVAPDFTASSYDGKQITLSALRQQGPVMLVFLRGFG